MKKGNLKKCTAIFLSSAMILTGTLANGVTAFALESEPVSESKTKTVAKNITDTTADEGILTITAKASQSRSGWDISPDNLVNRSGLSKKGSLEATHSNGGTAQGMWQTEDYAGSSVWVELDTGKTQELANMYIWNHNQYDGTDRFLKRGLHYVNVEYSSDGEKWEPLDPQKDADYNRELHMASGSAREPVNDVIALGITARYIRISANPDPKRGTFDGGGCYGLSEVMITHYMDDRDIVMEQLAKSMEAANKGAAFDYSNSKWEELQKAIVNAASIAGDENISIGEIEAVRDILDRAVSDTGIPSGVSDSLIKKIEEAQELREEDYTEESWKNAKSGIDAAVLAAQEASGLDVNDTGNAPQADDSLKTLTREIAKLRSLPKDRMEMYRELVNERFGMFLHYNMSTYTNNGQNPKYDFALEDWGPAMADPIDFDPADLDTDQWADAAVSAQMEFSCVTSKHHDGFDIWPSEVYDHNISKSSRPDMDVIDEYLTSFRSRGINAGLYFSILDLHLEAIEKPNFNGTKDQIRKGIYTKNQDLILGQIRELMTNYGDIPFLILDGWNTDWGSDLGSPLYTEFPYADVEELVHSLQPNCIIINISCEVNDTHTDLTIFENGAGQTIPSWFDKPGMACHNLQGQWFWNTNNPTQELQSVDWVLNQMCYPQNRKGCAFILNAAPNPEGKMDHNVLSRLKEIGEAYEKLPDLEDIPSTWYKDYDPSTNLAYKKPIKQSSVSGHSYGERAADGIIDGAVSHESVSATNMESNPWWQTDLGTNQDIGEITIWNTEGAAKENLSNFWIFASDKELTGTLNQLKNNKEITKIHVTEIPDPSITRLINTSARYIRIQIEGYKSLALSEVILSLQNTSELQDIYKISSLENKRVETGTSLEELNLPGTVEAVLSDGSKQEIQVEWDRAVPEYDSNGTGTYMFTGSPVNLPGHVTNTKNHKAVMCVTFEDIRLDIVTAPDVVKAGDTVILQGHFGKNPGRVVMTGPKGEVTVNADSPYLISWESDCIKFLVPGGVSSGIIYVETADRQQTNKDKELKAGGWEKEVFADNFEGYTTGKLNDQQTAVEKYTFLHDRISVAEEDGNKILRMNSDGSDTYLTKEEDWENVNISFDYRFDSDTKDFGGIYISPRYQDKENRYLADLLPHFRGGILYQRYLNNGYSEHGETAFAYETGVWYSIKMKLAGDELKVKMWKKGE